MRIISVLILTFLSTAALAYEEVPQAVYEAGNQETGSRLSSTAAVAPGTASEAAGPAVSPPAPAAASAAPVSAAPTVDLDEVVVTGRAANLVGRAGSASSGSVGQADLNERPLLRPAEVLEAVPGLLITQHSGDGKANQYFTRGFNLDHGTDFAFSVDGVPVNEPSNAHGQGYADLNFMIPELVQTVNYTKGPFNIEVGDFATAGSANFIYPTVLKNGIGSLTMGENGYERALAASQLPLLGGNLIYALEIDAYDGPWQVPERMKKYDGFLHYSVGPSFNRWVISHSAYEASWDATNQMPQDMISANLLSPYGNLSPTDGGRRDRDFLSVAWIGKTGDTQTGVMAYVGQSHMDLWNDFTLYLPYASGGAALAEGLAQSQFADPNATNGEQFLEQDHRDREGASAHYECATDFRGIRSQNEAGLDLRNDNIKLGLYNTDERVNYETIALNHIVESSGAPFVQNTTEWTPWLKTVLAFRQDFYLIQVVNETPTLAQQLAQGANPALLAPLDGFDEGAGLGTTAYYNANMPEPKAALIIHPQGSPVEGYVNAGQGFHSNDVRELAGGVNPLARAQGGELGLRFAQGSTYETTLAVWRLDLASELTFDGDTAASITNAASTRQGIEWSNTFRATPIYLDLDGALSQARFNSEDFLDDPMHPGFWVPEAIEQVGTATLGLDKIYGWSVDARLRYFGSRALTADDAERSQPATLVSLQVIRDLWAGQSLDFSVFNLFDQPAQDVSYYYAYAAPGVDGGAAHESVMGHVTEPRTIRVTWVDHF